MQNRSTKENISGTWKYKSSENLKVSKDSECTTSLKKTSCAVFINDKLNLF